MKQVIWLDFSLDQPFFPQIEFIAKSIFFSGNASLVIHREAGSANCDLSLTSSGKISFSKAYTFKAQTKIRQLEGVLVREYSEGLSTRRPSHWTVRKDEQGILFQANEDFDENSQQTITKFSRPVLDPLSVLPALSQSWAGDEAEYRALILGGRKVYGLRFLPKTSGPRVSLEILVYSAPGLGFLSETVTEKVSSPTQIHLVFDEETRQVEKVNASFFSFGKLEAINKAFR